MFKLDSIPDAISREAYAEVTRLLGFEPNDLLSLEFHLDGIYAEVFATNERGHRIVAHLGDECVKHKIFIPVKDGLEGDLR